MSAPYTGQFYSEQQASSNQSAQVIVPLLIQSFHPTSVVDVGCGVGTWLKEFIGGGVKDVLGLDGKWVEPAMLQIPEANFMSVDFASPPKLNRTFSIAVSVEVAEHLPESAAKMFVDFLTKLAPIVVFSAAVPGQGGTAHLNEQWQSYWLNLFKARGYQPMDFIRRSVWDNPNVCWWYAQNLLVYVDEKYAEQRGIKVEHNMPVNLIHPRFLQEALRSENIAPEIVFRAIPAAMKRRLRSFLKR